MTRLITATLLLTAALLAPRGGAAQSVLILDDTPAASEAADAAARLGLEATSTRNISAFVQAFRTRETWDLLILDVARSVFTPALIEPLAAHLAAGGPAIVSHGNVDGNEPLRTTLGLVCSGDPTTFSVHGTPAMGFDLFDSVETFPSPLVGESRYPDNGDSCVSASTGLVLARLGSADGPPIIVTSYDDQVLFNGVVYDALRSSAPASLDADGDGVPDVVELLVNEIHTLLALQIPEVVVFGDAPTPELDRLATELGFELLHPADLAALDTLIAEDDYWAAVFSFSDLSGADPAVRSRIDALRAGGTPVLFVSPDFDGSSDWQSWLGVEVVAGTDADEAVGLVGGELAVHNVLFAYPNPVPPLEVTGDGPGDSTDGLRSATLEPLAFAGGVARVLGDPDGGLVVVASALSELGGEDRDADGVTDMTEFLVNARTYAAEARAGRRGLVLTDAFANGLASEVRPALRDSGRYAVVCDSAEVAARTLAAGAVDLVAIENVGDGWAALGSTALVDALDAWIASDSPVVFAGVDLDGATGFASALGVRSTASLGTPRAVERDVAHLGRLFELPVRTPNRVAAGSFSGPDVGDSLAITAVGATAARFPDRSTALAITHNGRVAVLGIAPHAIGPTNTDGDRQKDVQQLLDAMIYAVETPQVSLVLDDGAGPSVFGEAAQRAGLRAEVVATPQDFVAALEAGAYQQVAIDSSESDALADPGLLEALAAWLGSNGRATIAYPNFDEAPAARALFGLEVGPEPSALENLVVPNGDTIGLFGTPYLVPSPLERVTASPLDYGDRLVPGAGTAVGARYRVNIGAAATILPFDGAAAVNGFRPREVGAADLDEDGVEDRVAFFANQMVRTGRVPVPVLSGPYTVDEGERITLDASGSRDPFGESLSFAWDLDRDGDFDDGDAATARFDAGPLDGPADTAVSLRLRNQSGLTVIVSVPIRVENVPPLIEAGSDRVINQGSPAVFDVSIVDVPGDTFLVEWDLGDGQTAVGATVTHVYAELGVYEVAVTVTDDDGGAATDRFSVEYRNLPPIIEIGSYGPIDEGSVLEVSAEASDAGGDPFTVRWTFGDGATAEGLSASHAYADNGTYTIAATATDDNGGSRTDTARVEVRNVAPTFTTSPPTTAAVESEYAYDAEASDPGADTVGYRLETSPTGMTVDAAGRVRWRPGTSGFRPVRVALVAFDEDGGSTTQEWTIELTFGDRDLGGAPDVCEIAFGFDPDDPDDDESDPDGDGLTVAQECLAGSDPAVFSGPAAPVLVSPVDFETVTTPFVELVVRNSPDPDGEPVSYDFALYADEALSELVAEALDVPEVATGRTQTMVIDEFVEDQIYYWRARAKGPDVSSPWSAAAAFVFNQRNQPPGRPTAIAPIGLADANPPTLRVLNAEEPEREALSYDFEVYAGQTTRPDFLVWSAYGVPEGDGGETSVEVGRTLDEDRQYTWRCRARDPWGGSGPYEVVLFEIDLDNSGPPAPEIVSPEVGGTVPPGGSVTLEWTNVDDPDGDRVSFVGDLATDEGFTDIVRSFRVPRASATPTTTSLVPHSFQPERTYHWRVAATDGRHTSPFVLADFTVDALFVNAAPSAPVPVSPLAGRSYPAGSAVELIVDNGVDPNGDPVTYTFQLALDVDMRQVIDTFDAVPEGDDGTTSLVLEELRSLAYFWRARATDGALPSAWSPVNGFIVQDPVVFPDAGPVDAGFDGPEDIVFRPRATGGQLGGGGGCASAAGRGNPQMVVALALAGLVFGTWRRRRS